MWLAKTCPLHFRPPCPVLGTPNCCPCPSLAPSNSQVSHPVAEPEGHVLQSLPSVLLSVRVSVGDSASSNTNGYQANCLGSFEIQSPSQLNQDVWEERSGHWYLLEASQETDVHRGLEMAAWGKINFLESVTSMAATVIPGVLRHDTHLLQGQKQVLAFPWCPDTDF